MIKKNGVLGSKRVSFALSLNVTFKILYLHAVLCPTILIRQLEFKLN